MPILPTPVQVKASPFDTQRAYDYFELEENKLACLVVSNPRLDKASAAMDVRVGYFYDPERKPGLAHFLEHMLFMGTAKYPIENEYSQVRESKSSLIEWNVI